MKIINTHISRFAICIKCLDNTIGLQIQSCFFCFNQVLGKPTKKKKSKKKSKISVEECVVPSKSRCVRPVGDFKHFFFFLSDHSKLSRPRYSFTLHLHVSVCVWSGYTDPVGGYF